MANSQDSASALARLAAMSMFSSGPQSGFEAKDSPASTKTKTTEPPLPPKPVSLKSPKMNRSEPLLHPLTYKVLKDQSPKHMIEPKDTPAVPKSPANLLYITLDESDNLVTTKPDKHAPTTPGKKLVPNKKDPFPASLFATLDAKSTSVPWFKPSLRPIPAPFRELLENYAGFAPEEVDDHIHKVRNTLWNTHPYPCLGMGYFLRLDLSQHPLYPTLLSILTKNSSATLLDLGCGLGQDLRKCAYDLSNNLQKYASDSTPENQLFAIDIGKTMVEGGGLMFRDRFEEKVFIGDLMEEGTGERAVEWWGGKRPQCTYVAKVFHLFGWEAQIALATGLVRLMVGEKKGDEEETAAVSTEEDSDTTVVNGETHAEDAITTADGEDANGGSDLDLNEEQKRYEQIYLEAFRKGHAAGYKKGHEAIMYEKGYQMGFERGFEKAYGKPSNTVAAAATAAVGAPPNGHTVLEKEPLHQSNGLAHSVGPGSSAHHSHPAVPNGNGHTNEQTIAQIPADELPMLIFGDQLGVEREADAGLQQVGFKGTETAYIHSPETLKKFWDEVGEKTGTRWEVVTTVFENVGPAGFQDDGSWGRDEGRLMKWGVRLVGGL